MPWSPRGVRGREPTLRWLAVLDSSVFVAAALARDPKSPNREVVELALAGVYICVISDYIQTEVTETLIEYGLRRDEVDALFGVVWHTAQMVALADDSEALRKAIVDEDDRPILRTAFGVYAVPELAPLPRKYLVSENVQHFPPGRNLYGFECIRPGGFLAELRRAARR